MDIASVDGKQHLLEVVFTALIGFSLLEKYPTSGLLSSGNRRSHIRRVRSMTNQRCLVFSQKKSESSARNVLEHCRDGGANCLLTTTMVSCGAQHHVGDGGHPYRTLWWLFDPVVRTRGTQWKSDNSTKHYLTQNLLSIYWYYWEVEKNYACVSSFKVTSCKRASLRSTRLSQKKVGYFSNRVV